MRKKTSLIYSELIGLRMRILSHTDPTFINRHGKIINETTNTFEIIDETKNKRIIVPKLYGIFEFKSPLGQYVILDGTLLHSRPEDRLKKMQK